MNRIMAIENKTYKNVHIIESKMFQELKAIQNKNPNAAIVTKNTVQKIIQSRKLINPRWNENEDDHSTYEKTNTQGFHP